jgi:hypothetical protein
MSATSEKISLRGTLTDQSPMRRILDDPERYESFALALKDVVEREAQADALAAQTSTAALRSGA